MSFAGEQAAEVVPGRSCGKCSLCCKVVRVQEIGKPPGVWCRDCAPGRGGCKIYESRPEPCRSYLCLWLTTKELGAEWYPATSKIVVAMEAEGNRISVSVDPAYPARWREEPYYARIKQWAHFGAEEEAQVIVHVGTRAIVVLPNKEIDLGEVDYEDHIMVAEYKVQPGQPRDWTAFVRKAADIPEDERDKWVTNYKR